MPTRQQIEAFVGTPYEAGVFDCGDLAVLVQQRLYGKTITLPGHRRRRDTRAATLDRCREELATPVPHATLRDGDVVIMRGGAGWEHVGTAFHLAGRWWVLHNSNTLGHTVLHLLDNLYAFGLRVEGFYRWK